MPKQFFSGTHFRPNGENARRLGLRISDNCVEFQERCFFLQEQQEFECFRATPDICTMRKLFNKLVLQYSWIQPWPCVCLSCWATWLNDNWLAEWLRYISKGLEIFCETPNIFCTNTTYCIVLFVSTIQGGAAVCWVYFINTKCIYIYKYTYYIYIDTYYI